MKDNLHVVLLYDWLDYYGKNAKVLEALCEMFPTAPLYTLYYKKGSTSQIIEDREITSSIIKKLPFSRKLYKSYLPIVPLLAESINIKEKPDLIISLSECAIKGISKPQGAKHLSYIGLPMKYIYHRFDSYFGKTSPIYRRIAGKAIRPYLKTWDKLSNENIDYMLTSSKFTQQEIRDSYKRDAQVVPPFISAKDYSFIPYEEKEDFYLMKSSFLPHDDIEFIIKAFNINGKKLRIIGNGPMVSRYKVTSYANIRFMGKVDESRYREMISKAKAVIFPCLQDYYYEGLEAMASGTPIITFQRGSLVELVDKDMGITFKEKKHESFIVAIDEFEKLKIDAEKLKQKAQDYSKENFKNKLSLIIDKIFE